MPPSIRLCRAGMLCGKAGRPSPTLGIRSIARCASRSRRIPGRTSARCGYVPMMSRLPSEPFVLRLRARIRPAFLAGRPDQPGAREIVASMEAAFGLSFAGVRIRVDDAAASRAAALSALAYNDGDEIGFAEGVYDPHRAEGLRTIAHEFAHVAQRRGTGRAGGQSLSPQAVDDARPGCRRTGG